MLRFSRNRGLLLAGGVGYNTLLSITPLFAVQAATVSRVVSEERMLTPGRSELLIETCARCSINVS